ncbi:Mu transposase C-terminal domain-containing protein [Laribacter hongkongensis]|uniref:Mu transposase C-terminal domain-containing protein n=1 Tax=Laribacter hongkongensis TaxID=168471 RepID=UPI001EFD57FD|nr:Mu transposase C-terminal domain-containing protein [Laribacter hongkongensis]MCG9065633.1 Mu transposase C-terminal domain-containing protein [Laribacter hongkongensis]
MATLPLLRLLPGLVVYDSERRYIVIDLLNATTVLVEDDHGQRHTRPAAELQPDPSPARSNDRPRRDLLTIPREEWEYACEIASALQPLVEKGRGLRTRAEVSALAERLHKHPATVYRWLLDYESSGLVSSLLRKPRKDKGERRLDPQVEDVIKNCIETFYLTSQRRTPAKTAFEVRKRCLAAGLTPPDPNTVRNRILAIDESLRVRKREGYKAANEKFQPILGNFPGADYPLAVVQIDHTPMDVIVVDDVHRLPIGRPYLTLAVDVFSKMVMGFYISLDPAGALSTGLCLSRAILGKEAYLQHLGIDDLDWPCWGLMRTIHTDNAKEFRGTMLGRAAHEYGIIAQRRPKGRPQYGGHVERAFRTYMSEVHNELPGTTFSNPRMRRDYDAEGHAVMTLDALEIWFTRFLLGCYHQRPHKGNDGRSPQAQWELGLLGNGSTVLGRGIPARYPDEERLRLDFLPYVERTVQEYGIAFEGVTYWSDALRRLVHAKDPASQKLKRQFVCRYDPRDLRRIWLFEPDGQNYLELPYRNLARSSISLWELRQAKKQLRAESTSGTNEELIFRTIDQMRELVASESQKTKAARRMQQRLKGWSKPHRQLPLVAPPTVVPSQPLPPEPDEDILPFDDIREA